MSKFLINESPLVILPTLASAIGLSEAIVLQQIQYWINNPKAGIVKDGFKWVYNTYEKWQEENFPFWTPSGVEKIFIRLEKAELLISKQLSENVWDKTKYYRINYEKLEEVVSPFSSVSVLDDPQKVDSTYNRDYSETTNTAKEEKPSSLPNIPLPIEWQIAAGITNIIMPDEKESQILDTADLIAMGTGINHPIYKGIAYAFMKTRGIIIPRSKVKGQRKAVKDMVEQGVLPNHAQEATEKLMLAGMTVTDLFAISKTAIDIANPAKQFDFSTPQESKFSSMDELEDE